MLNTSSYIDAATSLIYQSDAKYIDTGISMNISSTYKSSGLKEQFLNVRSFPQGKRNCYVLTPRQTITNVTYLIRASFLYGDYDGKGQLPEFDIHLGVNKWDSVSFSNSSTVVTKEITHFMLSEIIYVCLINKGFGTPFISLLELRRPIAAINYHTRYGSLSLFKRLNFGSFTNETVRYKDDYDDRIWEPFHIAGEKLIRNETEDPFYDITFGLPPSVIGTAVTPSNADAPLEFYLNIASYGSRFYFYVHFAEIQRLGLNEVREFDMFINGRGNWAPSFPDSYMSRSTVMGGDIFTEEWLNISLSKTQNSTLPPYINAMQIYALKNLSQPQTYDEDALAMMNIKTSYGVQRNWRGDPCAPKEFVWDGVICSYHDPTPARVTHLNLSSSGLTGVISPYIGNLTSIQYLDLSNNSLTGTVPMFLSELPFLVVINLSKNNLTGPLPEELLKKSKKGLVSVSMDGYSNPCPTNFPCKKKNKKTVIIVAAVTSSIVVMIALITITLWRYRRHNRYGQMG